MPGKHISRYRMQAERVKAVRVLPENVLVSFKVVFLFTTVPLEEETHVVNTFIL